MEWTYLLIAGLFEVVWAVGLKYAEGWTQLWPSVGTVAAMIVSFWFLSLALRGLPIGTAYAVWTGIGAAGTALVGIVVFGESQDIVRLSSIALIIAGITGLRLAIPGE
jgi:quaternary ammonium compound-resistance protein SugE